MAENSGGKARREAPAPEASLDPTKKTGASSDGAKFLGKCFVYDQRGHRAAEGASGRVSDSETSPAGKASAAKPIQAQAPSVRATETRQPRPMNYGGVAVAQRTRRQQSAKSGGSGEITGTTSASTISDLF